MRFTNGVLTAVVLALASVLAIAPLQSWAQETAANMPIADLHFHPGQNGKTPADVRDAFDRAGVRWFGLGAVSAPDALQASRAFGDRSISCGAGAQRIVDRCVEALAHGHGTSPSLFRIERQATACPSNMEADAAEVRRCG